MVLAMPLRGRYISVTGLVLSLSGCFGARGAVSADAHSEGCGADGCDGESLLQLSDRSLSARGEGAKLRASACPGQTTLWRNVDVFDDSGARRGQYSLSFRNSDCEPASLELVNNRGGQVQAFNVDGHSIVFDRPLPKDMDGTVFWASPQSAWGWPPPVELDGVPSQDYTANYKVEVDPDAPAITLTSRKIDKLGIRMRKTYSVDDGAGAVVADYQIVNVAGETKSYAPWEITRVRPDGLTFYMTGSRKPNHGPEWFAPLSVENVAGATWYQQDSSKEGNGKLYADTAQGWLAHTDGSQILVKCFEKIAADAAAPGEQQVEIYNGGTYVEVEMQGALESIEPGAALEWQVKWQQKKLPASLRPPKIGDQGLLDLARSSCEA